MSSAPTASSSSQRVFAVLAAAAVLVSFFAFLGRAPLFDVDEGAFSQSTLEMFQRGDFLSTYLNGQPRYDKPILVYWLQAASVAVLGVSEFALRLPSALCATLWAALTYLFVRRYFGLERALLAAAVLATSLGVSIIGRAATADALLNMLIAAAMFAAWLYLDTNRRVWLYTTFTAIGLGFLAKGPIAILVPFAVTFTYCLFARTLRTWARTVFDWRGLLLFAVIALPWYAAIFAKEGRAFFEGFFLEHNVGRFGGPLQGHAGSLVYYFPVVLAWTLPFTALLIAAAMRVRSIWADPLQRYLLLWFTFVFALFSLSGTKLPHYVLYGITGLTILMAVHADALRSRIWALAPGLLFFVAMLALPQIVQLALPRITDAYYREVLSGAQEYFTPSYFGFAAAGAAAIVAAMLERRVALSYKLVLAGLAVVLGLSAFLMPIGGELQQGAIKEAAQLCRSRGLSPILWRLNAPSFSVYRGQPTQMRNPQPGDVVLTRVQRLAGLPGSGVEVLYAKHGIVLAKITP